MFLPKDVEILSLLCYNKAVYLAPYLWQNYKGRNIDMNKDIRWIHISDLHIGMEKNKWIDNAIQDQLIYFLENDIGRIDFILITGDVINQGGYNNHNIRKHASEFIGKLRKVSTDIVFCVGNHDYQRSETRYKILSDWQNEKDKEKVEEQYASRLYPDFKEYVDFCRNATSEDNPISERSYIYENVSDINIIVLNTSTFSGQPKLDENGNIVRDNFNKVVVNDNGKIWISENELPEIGAINPENPSIVIGHHPLDMFALTARQTLEKFIKTINGKYLCGHVHKYTKENKDDIIQSSISGLFEDGNNLPSFTYNVVKKDANVEILSNRFIYERNWSILKSGYYSDNNLKVYSSLKNAITDLANDVQNSDFLCFFGLQGSTFLPSEDKIYSAISQNENLFIRYLISNPYNKHIIDRLRQIPKYRNQVAFENKLKRITNTIKLIKSEYEIKDNAIVKYHTLPIIYRAIITQNHLYIGMYENKDSSESKVYRFNSQSSIYKASLLHFNTFWDNAEYKIPSVAPEWYRVINNNFSITPSLVINVTDVCDMQCRYCPEGGENLCLGSSTCPIKSIKILIKTFKNLIPKSDKSVIRITGGEPFYKEAEDRTIEILKCAANNNYDKIVLCTNGVRFSEVYTKNSVIFDEIKEQLLLKISLDSVDEKAFNDITQTENKYKLVMSNI